MELASHNTMSYLKPANLWLRPFHFIAKCQNKTIEEQYALGVRMFDIRITFEKNGKPVFAHGLIKFKTNNVENVLDLINTWKDCYVRIILEENKFTKHTYIHTVRFISFVNAWIKKYKNIKFFEGRRKYDWNKIIVNSNLHPSPTYIQKVSSMTGTILDDWWPKLYAMFNNKKEIKKHSNNDGYLFIDYVGNYY